MSAQSTTPDALSAAIESLYATFSKYPSRTHVEGCAHCTTDADHAQLHSRPLRELQSADLKRFAFKALTTWGDNDDLRHFLPRIFELIVRDIKFPVDLEVVVGKLDYGEWQTWPEAEQKALRNYLYAVWGAILSSSTFWIEADTWLACLARANQSVQPALDLWVANTTLMSTARLVEFIDDNFATLTKKRMLGNAFIGGDSPAHREVLVWLMKPDTERRLEGCFFELKDEELAEKISAAIEQLRCLRERELERKN